ncbi:MAG: NAD-dependent deacylase [Archaeoglobus sp.]|nr:NAD-dependent deacylase [Archaeoglobus sp.]
MSEGKGIERGKIEKIDKIREIASEIKKSSYTTVLTGAGISAESGIPTFRGKDGLWNKYRPEELATPQAFARDPKLVWEWYAWRMKLVFSKKPNPAHEILAKLEEMGLIKSIITQNVDDLHERAGSRNVIHLHGKLRDVICSSCSYKTEAEEILDKTIPPRCPECDSFLRPGVVWFGESLPPDELNKAFSEAERSDLILVIGTSAVVQPAASIPLITKRKGGKIVEINPDSTPLTSIADISIRGKAGEVLTAVFDEIKL